MHRVAGADLGPQNFVDAWFAALLAILRVLIQGLAGVNRRLWDGGAAYQFAEPVLFMNTMMSHAAFTLGFFQLFFVVNLFMSISRGRATDTNPWQATTLEWATPTPPPHGNFTTEPVVYRMPYEYSVPGAKADFLPQFAAEEAK